MSEGTLSASTTAPSMYKGVRMWPVRCTYCGRSRPRRHRRLLSNMRLLGYVEWALGMDLCCDASTTVPFFPRSFKDD